MFSSTTLYFILKRFGFLRLHSNIQLVEYALCMIGYYLIHCSCIKGCIFLWLEGIWTLWYIGSLNISILCTIINITFDIKIYFNCIFYSTVPLRRTQLRSPNPATLLTFLSSLVFKIIVMCGFASKVYFPVILCVRLTAKHLIIIR